MLNSPTKSWTVMVYMAGDNDLDDNDIAVPNLMEMKSVGTTDHVNVVAQYDSKNAGHQTTRYLLKKGLDLGADVVDGGNLGPTNMGDPKYLEEFVDWAIKKHPAERYFLVLWNHGAGWDDTDVYKPPPNVVDRAVHIVHRLARNSRGRPALLFDDDAKDFLDNAELKEVVSKISSKLPRKRGRDEPVKLDLLGMDACLMSMPEVGYQMRSDVAFTIGSQQREPPDGWPYREILETLTRTPEMSADELGKVVVNEYLNWYKGGISQVTQSLCDLRQCAALADATKTLASSLTTTLVSPGARAAIREARKNVQSYSRRDYVDLGHLCALIKGGETPASVKTACEGVLGALTKYVVSSRYYGDEVGNSTGTAIYFPQKSVSPLYGHLDFVRDTGWDDFLNAYLQHPQ